MANVQSKQSGTKKLLMTLAGILAIASAVCFYIAATQFSETYVSTTPAPQPAGPPHDLIAFDQDGNLLGVSLKNGKFEVDKDSLEGGHSRQEINLQGVVPAQWLIGSDGKTLAWLAGPEHVGVQRVGQAPWPQPKEITAPKGLLTFGVLNDGSIGLALTRGLLVDIDPVTGKTLATIEVGGRVSWAQFRGDYAAVKISDTIRMFRMSEGKWEMMEERPAFSNAIELRLPADGQIVAITAAGIRVRDLSLNSPGKVADVAMTDQGFILVTGDFGGVWVLPPASDPYQIVDGPHGPQLAASRRALAYTSQAGTLIIPLQVNSRLTPTGRMLVAAAIALILLAIIAGLLLLFIDGKGLEPKRKIAKDGKEKDLHLPKPPPDLIAAITSGEATLWAGAGLSSPSGLPLRTAFISSLFQTAVVESWATTAQMEKYWKLMSQGKSEEALDQFTAIGPEMRIRVNDLIRATYHRFATLNEAQRKLARLPFSTAITTNYDCLLERTGSKWSLNVASIRGNSKILALGSHLVVKLYADFETAHPPILTRQEFKAALAEHPDFIKAFSDLFESRPILFVGASVEGLLVDLEMLNAPRPSTIKHYCVTGVTSGNWRTAANQLKSRYNIEVFPCDILNISDETKTFLADLAEAVEQELNKPAQLPEAVTN